MDEQELQGLDLEDIMKEFGGEDPAEDTDPMEEPQEQDAPGEEAAEAAVTDETVRIDIPHGKAQKADLGDTVRIEAIKNIHAEESQLQEPVTDAKAEPYSPAWEPEYEQPMGEYVPPQPIVFQPRSRLRELKRKLIAGPEKRYYELTEQGLGKLQIAIFLSVLVFALSAGATAIYAGGMMRPERLRLMVFSQFITMLLSATLGSYQMMEGIADMFRGRFSLNSMLVVTFAACCADGVFCLQELRVPCCAAFSLQVIMSLWSAYHKRVTELGQMDTLRKANHLDGLSEVADYHEGCPGLLRSEGELDDFLENYKDPSSMEKTMSVYALAALAVSVGIGVAGGVIHQSVSFGVQALAVSLLAAVPVTSFIAFSRPMAILERRLHDVGAVLCGWQGIKAMSRRVMFPLSHDDLFPVGCCKLNGVKFYGSRDPDEVIAYSTALVCAAGGGLVPLFNHLLDSRNGRHYEMEKLRAYGNGGIGGEVEGESVLVGEQSFLQDMGVEIPEGIRVNQAVYIAIDGELCGLVAVTYSKVSDAAAGLSALCACKSVSPVMTTGDFMLTESFIRGKFGVNTRRACFPEYEVRQELDQKEADADAPSLALITRGGLAPLAYAVTGARSVRTAYLLGLIVQLIGGILGLVMMLALVILGAQELLTPSNMLLYELVWLVPGLLFTEWTRMG